MACWMNEVSYGDRQGPDLWIADLPRHPFGGAPPSPAVHGGLAGVGVFRAGSAISPSRHAPGLRHPGEALDIPVAGALGTRCGPPVPGRLGGLEGTDRNMDR